MSNIMVKEEMSLKQKHPELYKSVARSFGFNEDAESPMIDDLVECELSFRRGLITLEECEKCQRQILSATN